MRTTTRQLAWRLDAFCGRLNAGLMAVAIVLAGVVAAAAGERALQQIAAPVYVLPSAAGPDIPVALP